MSGRKQLIIMAASGAASEVVGMAQSPATDATRYVIAGIIGTGELLADIAERLAVPVLGGLEDVPPDADVAISGGNRLQRERTVADLVKRNLVAATLIHADTTLGPWVTLGAGCLVSPGVRITGNVSVGDHCQLHTASVISHDDVLEDHVVLSPSVTLCGAVTVERGAMVFAGATVMPGITIGADAVVGAGALVNADVAPGSTVVGVPARPLG